MAVKDINKVVLRVILEDGVDLNSGQPLYSRRNFNNIFPYAETKDIYDTLDILMDLQDRPVYSYEQVDTSELRPA